jgi:hypothetical protein
MMLLPLECETEDLADEVIAPQSSPHDATSVEAITRAECEWALIMSG